MPHFKRPLDDVIVPAVLYEHLEKYHGFIVSTKIPNDNTSYELPRSSLRRHCTLLAEIRPTETVAHGAMLDYSRRIMGDMWFGRFYRQGVVIEGYGKGIQVHMNEFAKKLQQDFDGDIQVLLRASKTPRFM